MVKSYHEKQKQGYLVEEDAIFDKKQVLKQNKNQKLGAVKNQPLKMYMFADKESLNEESLHCPQGKLKE